jgi:hypothetical protein
VRARRLILALAIAAPAPALEAAQPQFWRIEGAGDFLAGDLEGLSVDSAGRVRLAPASRQLYDPEAPQVWSLARDAKGALYAGTGNDGRIYRFADGKGSLLFDAPELEVHALAVGPDGRVYAGTSPEGKVYAIDAAGKAETFYDPPDKYIWALAFDAEGRLLVGTGGEGRLHRVDKGGKAQVLLTSGETHITALATDLHGHVYAGSAPGGILYRLDAAGHVFVMYDSPFHEVKALATNDEGSLYAAVVDGESKEDAAHPQPASGAPAPTLPPVEISITESVTALQTPPATPAVPARTAAEPGRAGAVKGAVLRIPTTGEVETLWSSSEDMPHSLLALPHGAVFGTGDDAKLFEVRDDRTWTMVVSLASEQITALLRGDGAETLVATANPGRLHALSASAGARGSFTSKAQDTDTVSTWGRLRWDATTPAGTAVELETRSGNTGTPDTTWSPWSATYKEGAGSPVTSEKARFLQVRAVLTGRDGATPVLDAVTTPYLQRNLRPLVTSVTVYPPGEIFQKPLSVTGDLEILGLDPGGPGEARPGASAQRAGQPPPTAYSRRLYQRGIQTFTWKAEDANGDTLSYDVHYRPLGEQRFRVLRQGLGDPVLAWDTSTVPNGRYVVRVTASDAPSNPDALALAGDRESTPFDVDNTPPGVALIIAGRSPLRVGATVTDETSLVRKAEYSIDGGRWEEVHPVDGINDARQESYEFSPRPTTPGPHLLVLRASDLLGNVATARIEIP